MTEQLQLQGDADHHPYLFTQRDFVLLAENGAFDGVAKAELVQGTILAVNAQYSRHVRAQTLLFRSLAAACDELGENLSAWVEGSISAGTNSLPQPDIFVAADLPQEGPIPASSVTLVVEIADTSLVLDLGAKACVYAAAGIPEYWVADVNSRVIHQLWDPVGEAYSRRREVAFGEVVEAVTVEGLRLETGGLA
jgi:Uma2 family endonuclease